MNYKSTTHRERFVHLRAVDTEIVWPHGLRKIQARTVFLREESPGVWNFSYADCSNKDPFNRKVGRQVARRRYFAEPHRFLFTEGEHGPTFAEVVDQALRYLPKAG